MGASTPLELSIKIAGQVDKSLYNAFGTVNKQIGGMEAALTTISRVGRAGLAAIGAAGVGAALALNNCTDEAMKFQQDMAKVTKYVEGLADANGNINVENYQKMADAIQYLSTEIPMTTEELTQLAAAAGQSGYTMETILTVNEDGGVSGFLRDAAVMGTAMDISAEQAGDWMAKWEKAFNVTHDDVLVLADQINYLGAHTATTAAEIAGVVNTIGGLGQVAGMDLASTAALADAMLAMGVDDSKAATSIRNIAVNLTAGVAATGTQQEAFARLGLTAEGVAAGMQENGVETLLQVFRAVQELPADTRLATLNQLFGKRAVDASAKIAGNVEALVQSLEMVSDPLNYTGSMSREFIINADTTQAVETQRQNAITMLKQDIGQQLLPLRKELALMSIELFRSIDANLPDITNLANSALPLLQQGIVLLGQAFDRALPAMQSFFDYLANNGQQAAGIAKAVVLTLAGMSMAKPIASVAGGVGSLVTSGVNLLAGTAQPGGTQRTGGLLGGLAAIYRNGQAFPGKVAGAAANAAGTVGGYVNATRATMAANGMRGPLAFLRTLGAAAITQTPLERPANYIGSVAGGIAQTSGNLWNLSGNLAQGMLMIPQTIKNILAHGLANPAGAAGTGLGAVGKNILTSAGATLTSGLGTVATAVSPIVTGFASLFTGIAPIIAGISTIIALFSILGDHLGDIRGLVKNTFGEKGVAVFDTFRDKLGQVGNFVASLFQSRGVSAALEPVANMIQQNFGNGAAAGFNAFVGNLQSVMNVIGQIVSFANNQVKPIIESIFNYITGTVAPILLQTFTAMAPYISQVIDGLGSAIMTGINIIGQAINLILPYMQGFITLLLQMGSVVAPALMAGLGTIASGIATVMEGIQNVFNGIVEFINNVFAGNWAAAWGNIQQIFGDAWNALVDLAKIPLNAVISAVNSLFAKIGGVKIPEWAQEWFGMPEQIALPQFDLLARGGLTNGPSIAGEAGQEAVISFMPSERGRNIDLWKLAGQRLGVYNEVRDLPETAMQAGAGQGMSVSYSPNITIQGSASRQDVESALQQGFEQFCQFMDRYNRAKVRTAY